MGTKLGAHLSTAGGYGKALEKIVQIGGNCLQIFSTSPRGWNIPKISAADAKNFIAEKKELGVDPIYFHASYLINLADPGSTGHLSKRSLIAELAVAQKAGVRGSVVHLGSFKLKEGEKPGPAEWRTLIKNLSEVLAQTPKETHLYIENAGNRKIGKDVAEIGRIIKEVGSPRLMVCLDTCHLHAAGYNLSSPQKLEAFLAFFDAEVGLNRLELVHMNDSRDLFGSLRDRHDNIGEGYVGREVFRLLLNHPATKNLVFIIETPGFDGNGPDKKNLDRLKMSLQD
jgi:deoxyribonuclease-4